MGEMLRKAGYLLVLLSNLAQVSTTTNRSLAFVYVTHIHTHTHTHTHTAAVPLQSILTLTAAAISETNHMAKVRRIACCQRFHMSCDALDPACWSKANETVSICT